VPQTPLREGVGLQLSPDLLVIFKGPTSKGREGKREGRGMEGEGEREEDGE